jgi:hypothetical protein
MMKQPGTRKDQPQPYLSSDAAIRLPTMLPASSEGEGESAMVARRVDGQQQCGAAERAHSLVVAQDGLSGTAPRHG